MLGRLPEGAVGYLLIIQYANGVGLLASKEMYKRSLDTYSASQEYFENPYTEDTWTLCVYPSNIDKIVIIERKNIGAKDILICVDLNIVDDKLDNDNESPVFFLAVVNSGTNLLPPNWYRTEYYSDYYLAISNMNGVLDNYSRR